MDQQSAEICAYWSLINLLQYLTENDLFDIFAYSDRDFNSLFVSFRSAPAVKQKKQRQKNLIKQSNDKPL